MLYEQRKHDGTLPIVGVNTFLHPAGSETAAHVELARSDEHEKNDQIERLRRFQAAHGDDAPGALERLRQAALDGDNIFDVLMDAVRSCSLGQITDALFDAGGRYRRNV